MANSNSITDSQKARALNCSRPWGNVTMYISGTPCVGIRRSKEAAEMLYAGKNTTSQAENQLLENLCPRMMNCWPTECRKPVKLHNLANHHYLCVRVARPAAISTPRMQRCTWHKESMRWKGFSWAASADDKFAMTLLLLWCCQTSHDLAVDRKRSS